MFNTYGFDHCAWSPQIQPAGYHRSSWTIYVFWSLYYLYYLLQKDYIVMAAKLRSLKWLIQKLLYRICSNIKVDYVMGFGLEQEDMSVITPITLAHTLHPIRSRPRNKRRNLWVGWCVAPWRHWLWSVLSLYYYIHTIHYSCMLSNRNKLFRKSWSGHDGVLDDMILLQWNLSITTT